MKLSMMISYSGDFHADVKQVVELEKAGLDVVWVPEAYSFDAVSQMGYLAAKTETIEIGAGILNVFSRTATCMAQTAAGLDFVSDGRFILGLGASGPQVIEGFHGVPYEKPMPRIRDYINVCRMTMKREKVVYDGPTVRCRLPEGQGTGLGKPLKLINHPVRDSVPIFWASLMGLSVKNTAQYADGWLPIFFDPEKFHNVWGDDLKAGHRQARPGARPAADLRRWHGRDRRRARRRQARQRSSTWPGPNVALYVGGMGARDKNFYNTICQKYGYVEEAIARSRTCTSRARRTKPPPQFRGDAREHEPGRSGRLRQGAPRRIQGSRCHAPVGQRRRRRPRQDRSSSSSRSSDRGPSELRPSSTVCGSGPSELDGQTMPRSHHRLSAQAADSRGTLRAPTAT